MSHFAFVNDTTLRKNLDIVFDHTIDLLALSESKSYNNKTLLVSSLRKTIIIHTASIIEALLLYILKQKINCKEFELSDEWRYFDINVLYCVQNIGNEIIAGKRKREKRNIDRLDFDRIINLCLNNKIIGENLSKEIDSVRKLRNRLHLGGLKEIENKYTHKDLEYVFNVAKKTKNIFQTQIHK